MIVRSQNVKLGDDGNKKMVASIRDENVKLTKCHRPPVRRKATMGLVETE